MTVGKYVIDPAVLAHLSDLVPYERRGRTLALTELSWSLAFFLGVPAASFSGRTLRLALALPGPGRPGPGRPRRRSDGPAGRARRPAKRARPERFGPTPRPVIANPSGGAGARPPPCPGSPTSPWAMSNELVNFVFGVWLRTRSVSSWRPGHRGGIGIAEFGAARPGAHSRHGRPPRQDERAPDRPRGQHRCGRGPAPDRPDDAPYRGLALFYLTFEYTVVSMLPVMSEILPQARATLLALDAASCSLGRALGSLASPRLYACAATSSGCRPGRDCPQRGRLSLRVAAPAADGGPGLDRTAGSSPPRPFWYNAPLPKTKCRQ